MRPVGARLLASSTLVALLTALLPAVSAPAVAGGGSTWVSAGHDIQNTRYQNAESKIDPSNVANLAVKWQFTTGGDVSATAAVDGSTVYVPDWAGNLYAIDQKTGSEVWSHKVGDYTGITGDFSTTTPVVYNSYLIFGDQGGRFGGDAWLIAVSKQTGALAWKTQVESVGWPVITQSAVVDASGNTARVYVGVASVEDQLAADPGYTCCSFRGSMLALDADTGQILWKTYTVPDGYSGGAVSGSTAAIDHPRNSLYIDTGYNYSLPQDVQACVAAAVGDNAVRACISPDDHFDSLMAIDLATGAIKWATSTLAYDAWTFACLTGGSDCPSPAGPAYGFDQGPALFTVRSGGGKRQDLLGAGQKSGQYWTLDPSTGAVVWETQDGPGSRFGGLAWGSAVDGTRVYTADANGNQAPLTLLDGSTTTNGFWSGLDAITGEILWETADPADPGSNGIDTGAVSAANGVVYGCSMDPQGHMYALDAATGDILWGFASGGSCAAGAAISNGVIYWGSGYSDPNPLGTPNNKFYAFGLP